MSTEPLNEGSHEPSHEFRDDKKGFKPLPYELSGNLHSNQLLVFMHGYPDTLALWHPIIAELEADYYCLSVSYPNFSDREKNKKGIKFEDLLDRLKVTIDGVNDTQRKIIIVSHDWGAILSYWFDQRYPNFVKEIISYDVGQGAKKTFFGVFYQLFLTISFLLCRCLGDGMTRWMVTKLKYRPPHFQQIGGSWNYFYADLWGRILRSMCCCCCAGKNRIPFIKYEPTCDIVYTYATDKPFQFHGDEWIQMLEGMPNSEVHTVTGGHWIPVKHPQLVVDTVKRRAERIKTDHVRIDI